MAPKVLIIRFSSFGDIAQALAAAQSLKDQWPKSQIDWVVRSDFAEFLRLGQCVDRVLEFTRKDGLMGLWSLARKISHGKYTHVYDAHDNLRSLILVALLRLHIRFWRDVEFVRRPKQRLRRFLMFQWQIPALPYPSIGALTYLWPLREWGVKPKTPRKNLYRLNLTPQPHHIALLPSAAWPLKRWPIEKFKQFVRDNPKSQFTVFAGPGDTFAQEIATVAPERVTDLTGKISLIESCQRLATMSAVIGSDTGLMHVADGLGIPLVMLVGPSAFGYPYNLKSSVSQLDLHCMPCSKDGRNRCKNPEWQKCLKDLRVEQVQKTFRELNL